MIKINGLMRSSDAAVGAVYIVSCNFSTVDGHPKIYTVQRNNYVIVELLELSFH